MTSTEKVDIVRVNTTNKRFFALINSIAMKISLSLLLFMPSTYPSHRPIGQYEKFSSFAFNFFFRFTSPIHIDLTPTLWTLQKKTESSPKSK